MRQPIKYDFSLREKTAVDLHTLSRKVHIPAPWVVEDAVQTLLSSADGPVCSSLKQGYARAMKEAELHDAFDEACEKAIEHLGVIVEWERPGWRYEAIAFDGKKLVRVSARYPLKRGQKVTPQEISLAQSVEWAAERHSEPEDELPDGGGTVALEARWCKMIAAELKRRQP